MDNNDITRHAKTKGTPIVKSLNVYTSANGDSPEFTESKFSADYTLIERLDACLSEIEGQAYAVQAVKEYLFGINSRENAKGVGGLMVFLGPPAVGKTMMGEKIAEALHRPFFRLDMSGYNDHEVGLCDLFGVNKTYRAAQEGRLTSFVEENPVSVVMLDEFEKAHKNIHNRFLQIFDRGMAHDMYTERNVSFRDVIVIVTMNLGQAIYDRAFMTYHLSDTPQRAIVHALRSEIDPQTEAPYLSDALVSRLASGKIILFNRLRPEIMHRITVNEIERRRKFYEEKYGLRIELDKDAIAMLFILNLGEGADVRAVIKSVREFFEKNLERLVRMNRTEKRKTFTTVRCVADFSGASEEALRVFQSGNKVRVLVCCRKEQREIFRSCASEGVEMVFAEKRRSPVSLADGDISLAILDAAEEDRLFAKRLFSELTEREEIPVYVYDLKSASDVPLIYYLDHGATDVFHTGGKLPEAQIGEILRSLGPTSIAQAVFRANKVVTFETSYAFERSNVALLKITDIDISVVHDTGDIGKFVEGRQVPDVHFDDIFGAEDAKAEMLRVLDLLKNFKKYRRLGVRMPRGILLEGDPGTGKTMMAKALACEAGLPFIQRNASEFGQKYIGEGARLMREMFAAARRYAPAIVFIDEVDTFAKAREGEAREWAADILNAFLSEMDGFSDHSATPVFVIAATNFLARKGETVLDPAFLRRFDRKIHIDLPDLGTRKKYLAKQISNYGNEVTVRMIENLAKRSIGWSLGELDNVIQNALRETVASSGSVLTDARLNESFETYLDGASRSRDEKKMRQTAVHEAGHAVVAALLGLMPSYATIGARGGYGGYVYYGDESETVLSRQMCLDRIAIMMAGREAETAFYGEEGISSGASGDLKSATELAVRMLCDYGMDEEHPVSLEPSKRAGTNWVAERSAAMIVAQKKRACEMINANLETVKSVADALLEKVNLDETDLKRLIG